VPPDGAAGNLPICLVAVEPQPRRVSNVAIFAANFQEQSAEPPASDEASETASSKRDDGKAD
jgi:hypothetical protein